MSGEQSVHSDEASKFRKVLEKPSPNSTYSPRTELLSDADSHKAHRTKTHRASSYKRHHSRSHKDRERGAAADIISLDPRQLSRLLAREELEAIDMRKVLIQTSQRLEQETRRATEAEARAREAEARVLAMQVATQAARADAQREQEIIKAYRAQNEVARNEILRAQKELDDMAAEKAQAEAEAAKERGNARALAREMEIKRAFEQGREVGKTQGFMDGRKEGWHLGTRQGVKEAYKEMMYNDDDSVSSRSSTPPPGTYSQQPPVTSMGSTTNQSAGRPPPTAPDNPSETNVGAASTRTATPQTRHKRSESFAKISRPRYRVNSDPDLPPPIQDVPAGRVVTNPERADNRSRPTSSRLTRSPSRESIFPIPVQNHPSSPRQGRLTPSPSREQMSLRTAQNRPSTPRQSRLSPSPSREQISPIPVQNRPSTPRHSTSSPLPSGFIPLQENGRVSLPPPHELEPPPPSPHTPAVPLPPQLVEVAPTITVQEPTPPDPLLRIPESSPAAAPSSPVAENNIKPSMVLAREQAIVSRSESPPLPPLPGSVGAEPSNKGKQRQRMGPPRAGTGLHAPGRSSPSDTSTEFSQFDIIEQPERVRGFGMVRSNGSQLSVIMEGGSSIAESPEPERNQPSTRVPLTQGPPTPTGQGILNDPREYAELSDISLTPTKLAHRRLVADQLRYSPSDEGHRSQARSARDDVSIKSSTTTRTSAPRRRPNLKMPERLAASKDVEALEKQAEMYDAFGTGRSFPTFDSQSSPDDVSVPIRAPRSQHRRSSSTTVPEITVQPPSRPSSKGSKLNHLSSEQLPGPMPAATIPSRRHSLQGSPVTPSRVPLPLTGAQVPISLGTPQLGELGLPPGFVPMQGPPMAMTPSRVPLPLSSGQIPMSLGTPRLTDMGLPPGFVPMQGPSEVLEAFSSGIPSQSPGMDAGGMPSKTPRMSTGTLSLHGGFY